MIHQKKSAQEDWSRVGSKEFEIAKLKTKAGGAGKLKVRWKFSEELNSLK